MSKPIAIPGEAIVVAPADTTRMTSLATTLVRTSQVEVIQLIVPAGRNVPTHEAQGDLLVHCLEGRVSLAALGKDHQLKSGQLLYLTINEPFSIRGIENASLLVTIIAAKTGGSVQLFGA
jgi:quercetin dioxygenase-like cupin family protein